VLAIWGIAVLVVSDGSFRQLVARLAAQVRTAPGVTHVATGLSAGSRFVSSDQHTRPEPATGEARPRSADNEHYVK
jgi:hypothetical protein